MEITYLKSAISQIKHIFLTLPKYIPSEQPINCIFLNPPPLSCLWMSLLISSNQKRIVDSLLDNLLKLCRCKLHRTSSEGNETVTHFTTELRPPDHYEAGEDIIIIIRRALIRTE